MTSPTTDPVPPLRQPFSNMQLELLKLFSDNVAEEDLRAIQRLIARYFADKAADEADQIWDEKKYEVEQMRQEHARTAPQAVRKGSRS